MADGGTILIVDDSAANRLLLRAILSANTPFSTVEAKDGETALGILDETDDEQLPKAILLDIMMPGIDGFSVAKALKSQKRTQGIPIIFITALSDMDSVIRGFEDGGADYLIKPIHKGELLARLNAHVALRRLTGELEEANDRLTVINQELAVQKVALERLNDQKNQLIGVVAHDLRNPLTVIMTLAELLTRQLAATVTERQAGFFSRMFSASQLMLTIINDLLDIQMIETGTLALHPVPTDLVALLERCVELNNVLSEYKGTRITLGGQDAFPPLQVDPARIEQVMNNLLSNAVKYSPRDSTVNVSFARKGDKAEVRVRDEGQGIPAEELELIFLPFRRATPKPTAGEKSVGLGLAIVKKIVEAHGGAVTVESRVGDGTIFQVSLPLGLQEAVAAGR